MNLALHNTSVALHDIHEPVKHISLILSIWISLVCGRRQLERRCEIRIERKIERYFTVRMKLNNAMQVGNCRQRKLLSTIILHSFSN